MPRQVVAAIIERPDRRLLIGQRRAHDSSPLKWEFPGGKVEPGESETQALARELREDLGVTLLRHVFIAQTQFRYADRELLTITFFAAAIRETELQPGAFERVAWVLPRELGNYDFLAANGGLIAELATGRIKPAELLSALPDAGPESP